MRGPLWRGGGWSGEALSREARLEGAEEEPEALRAPDFLLLAPARRREVAGSDAGESAAEGAASRRFSSIETRRRKGGLGKKNIWVSETVVVLGCLPNIYVTHCPSFCYFHSLHSLWLCNGELDLSISSFHLHYTKHCFFFNFFLIFVFNL